MRSCPGASLLVSRLHMPPAVLLGLDLGVSMHPSPPALGLRQRAKATVLPLTPIGQHVNWPRCCQPTAHLPQQAGRHWRLQQATRHRPSACRWRYVLALLLPPSIDLGYQPVYFIAAAAVGRSGGLLSPLAAVDAGLACTANDTTLLPFAEWQAEVLAAAAAAHKRYTCTAGGWSVSKC